MRGAIIIITKNTMGHAVKKAGNHTEKKFLFRMWFVNVIKSEDAKAVLNDINNANITRLDL